MWYMYVGVAGHVFVIRLTVSILKSTHKRTTQLRVYSTKHEAFRTVD